MGSLVSALLGLGRLAVAGHPSEPRQPRSVRPRGGASFGRHAPSFAALALAPAAEATSLDDTWTGSGRRRSCRSRRRCWPAPDRAPPVGRPARSDRLHRLVGLHHAAASDPYRHSPAVHGLSGDDVKRPEVLADLPRQTAAYEAATGQTVGHVLVSGTMSPGAPAAADALGRGLADRYEAAWTDPASPGTVLTRQTQRSPAPPVGPGPPRAAGATNAHAGDVASPPGRSVVMGAFQLTTP